MRWHIVRKDLAQLWIFAAIAAFAEFANAGLWFALGPFQQPQELVVAAQVFPFVVWIAILFLTVAAVHQDPIPGASQDWLVRPIRRMDLLQAKLLFLLITVHGPMLLADIMHAIANGFPIRASFEAAILHGAAIFVVVELPLLALATITTSVMQVMLTLLGAWLIVFAAVLTGTAIRVGTPPPFALSGMQWMTPAFWMLLIALAAFVIIPLQYFRRETSRARRIVGAAVILAPTLSFSSWGMVFSFQEALSPHPADAANVALVLSPAAKPATPISSDNTVRLPVTISGLPPESLLLIDRAYIHLLGLDGTGLYRGRTTLKLSSHHDFVHAEEGGEVHTIQQIEFPAKIYELVRTRPVRAEIEFSLTLFQTEDTETMNPLNGDKRMAAFGWCKARVDDDGDEIQLGCIKPGAAPSCFGLELENPESGGRNPETLVCDPDYAPYALPFYPDAVSQFGGAVRFADKHGFANFPVDASQLPQATLMVQWYRPGAHFTRDAAAEIQPADWVLH